METENKALVIGWKPVRYSIEVASARLRAYLPVIELKSAGVDAEIFKEGNIDKYDVVVFQKAYSEKDIDIATRLKKSGKKIVFDLCDNHYITGANKRGNPEKLERLNAMVGLADYITVPSEQLANTIEHKNIVVIRDCIESFDVLKKINFSPLVKTRHFIRNVFTPKNTINIVWFGNVGEEDPPWGLIDLARLKEVFFSLADDYLIRLSIITYKTKKVRKYFGDNLVPYELLPWSYSAFPQYMKEADICVLPVSKNEVTKGKSSNRLTTALLLGVPVVADEIDSYIEYKPYIKFANWEENIRFYIENPEAARQMVDQGRQYILEEHSNAQIARDWKYFLEEVVESSA